MSWIDSNDDCTCGHKQRYHVAGRGRCPVIYPTDDGNPCTCSQYTEANATEDEP